MGSPKWPEYIDAFPIYAYVLINFSLPIRFFSQNLCIFHTLPDEIVKNANITVIIAYNFFYPVKSTSFLLHKRKPIRDKGARKRTKGVENFVCLFFFKKLTINSA